MSTNRAVVTGRGGVGNVRKVPLKLDVSSSSHPQTASILAQHEASSLEYEREVMKRNREAKANTPRVTGRGGIGNITEANPRNPAKPLRRASLFKGGGAGVVPVSPVNDIFDMNAYDDEERRKYTQDMGFRRHSGHGRRSLVSLNGPGSGGNSPLSPDSEHSESEMGSTTSSIYVRSLSTVNLAFPESPTSPISPTSPSKEKHGFTALWKKVAKSKQVHARSQNRDLLIRAQMAIPPSQLECIQDYPDFPADPACQEVYVGRAI